MQEAQSQDRRDQRSHAAFNRGVLNRGAPLCRALWLVAMGAVLGAAAPVATNSSIAAVTLNAPLPLPPKPPTLTQSAASEFTPAPLPSDAEEPHLTTQAHTEVTPSLFTPYKNYRGDGYIRGSVAQEKHGAPVPGINVKVPLE